MNTRHKRRNIIDVQRKYIDDIHQIRVSLDNLTIYNSSLIFANEHKRTYKTCPRKQTPSKQINPFIRSHTPYSNRALQQYVSKKLEDSPDPSAIYSDIKYEDLPHIPKKNFNKGRLTRLEKLQKMGLCVTNGYVVIEKDKKTINSPSENKSRMCIMTPTVIDIYGGNQIGQYIRKTQYAMKLTIKKINPNTSINKIVNKITYITIIVYYATYTYQRI